MGKTALALNIAQNVAKHRNGPTGKVNLLFRNEYTKFVSVLPS